MGEISNLQFYIFTGVVIISYILNGILLIGKSELATEYINTIDFYFKIYISLYIIYRFNAFKAGEKLTNLDRNIIFTSGVFLFTTTIIHKILITYLDSIKQWFTQHIHI